LLTPGSFPDENQFHHQLRPIVDLELFEALTKAMAGSANGAGSFTTS
jgi:hypothetical protein